MCNAGVQVSIASNIVLMVCLLYDSDLGRGSSAASRRHHTQDCLFVCPSLYITPALAALFSRKFQLNSPQPSLAVLCQQRLGQTCRADLQSNWPVAVAQLARRSITSDAIGPLQPARVLTAYASHAPRFLSRCG